MFQKAKNHGFVAQIDKLVKKLCNVLELCSVMLFGYNYAFCKEEAIQRI